jgi:hypothetical protein
MRQKDPHHETQSIPRQIQNSQLALGSHSRLFEFLPETEPATD